MSNRSLGSIVSDTRIPPGFKVLEEVGVVMSAPSRTFRLFLRVRRKSWPGPIVIVKSILGCFIVETQGSALAPFICMVFSVNPSEEEPAKASASSVR